MNRILLILLMAFPVMMQAQLVSFTDPDFKEALISPGDYSAIGSSGQNITIDLNGDGEIQVSEALLVWELRIDFNSDIASLQGIEAFENLRSLDVSDLNLTSLNVTALQHLEELDCNNNAITTLNLSGLSNLKWLDCSMQGNMILNSLSLTGVTALEYLDCSQNALSFLDISELVALEHLNFEYNEISSILDLSGQPLIQTVICNANNIPEIIIEDKPHLTKLECGQNQIQELVLDQIPMLADLRCNDNQITSIDVSGCPLLGILRATSTPLTYLNLKNGNTGLSLYLSYVNNYSDHLYICVDEGEEENIEYYLDIYYVNINYQMSTYCSFFPGGDYNVITGLLSFDKEGDGCDSNDTVISNIKLNINDGTESGSTISSTGLYSFYTQAGTFTVTPDFENDHFTITPPFAEINFTEVDSLVTTQNFCLTPNGNHPDLDIVVVPFGARPGFDADYKITYRNKGNQTLSGDILFAYQEDELDFVSANPTQDSSSSGTLIWNYIGLAPFEQRQIFVTLNVNGPMETPAVNIDDNLQFTATINPVTGDDTPLDNVFGLKETVIGSFDPNDITCLEGRSVNPDKIGEYLHYNINFENTGTAPATFIVVKDVIDTTQFEMATLQMIHASHPVQATVTGNKVEFRFDEINLGPQGKGNVVFKVKTLNTLQVNDDVTQQADIFFDYNWPIVTNEATTVFEVLSRGEFEKDNTIKIYPNPSNGLVNITAASEIKSFELYDVQGRLLQAGGNASLDISGRAAGMYFVKVFTEAGMKVEKVVKK